MKEVLQRLAAVKDPTPEGVQEALAGFDLWKLLQLVLVIVKLILDEYQPKT